MLQPSAVSQQEIVKKKRIVTTMATSQEEIGYKNRLYHGDCEHSLLLIPDNSVDLIITSPPYADQRKDTYGGIHPDQYVVWFLPKAKEMLRVLKPTGSFILNIKERVVDGERHTYVMELIIAMR